MVEFLGANLSAMSVISSSNEIVLENSLSERLVVMCNLVVLSSLVGVLIVLDFVCYIRYNVSAKINVSSLLPLQLCLDPHYPQCQVTV